MTNSLVCADAGLLLKLVLPEPDSALARRLWDTWQSTNMAVVAPTLWGYEVTSVIRNKVYRNRFPADREADAIETIHNLPVQLLAPAGLHQRAWEIAHHFNRPAAYDAHYLALAEQLDCPFWTADERLFNSVRAELDWVHWLGDYRPPIPVN